MSKAFVRSLFPNLPVRDLERSKRFFSAIGFEFNPQFTDDTAACMVVSEHAYVMLLTEKRFADFTCKPVADARKVTEGILAISASTREEVDRMGDKALAEGGSAAQAPSDLGFMYTRSFFDPDGHHWEVFWMDPSTLGESA